MVILTLLDISALCTGWYRGAEIQLHSCFTQLYSRNKSQGYPLHMKWDGPRTIWRLDFLHWRGDRTTIRNSPSPYPSRQSRPSWLDTVQAERVLLQMKSQPHAVLTELSIQHKWVNTKGQRLVMSEGTRWLPPCRNIGKHCPVFQPIQLSYGGGELKIVLKTQHRDLVINSYEYYYYYRLFVLFYSDENHTTRTYTQHAETQGYGRSLGLEPRI